VDKQGVGNRFETGQQAVTFTKYAFCDLAGGDPFHISGRV